jgi:hypothetical protein
LTVTAYFKEREGRETINALRRTFGHGRATLPRTLTVVDAINSALVIVEGGMTAWCNPGDRLINKIIKQKGKSKYVTWAMQQQVNEVTGRLPAPSRSLCAKWVAEAIEQISQRTIVRSFVACRVTRPEDYSDSERQAFGLDDLIHMGHVRALAAVIDDDDELRAQLEAVSDADDDEWLHDERTTHVPEQHEEPADWEPDAAEPEDGGAAKASGAAASSRQSVPPTKSPQPHHT